MEVVAETVCSKGARALIALTNKVLRQYVGEVPQYSIQGLNAGHWLLRTLEIVELGCKVRISTKDWLGSCGSLTIRYHLL